MSDVLATRRARHQPILLPMTGTNCQACVKPWPCDAAVAFAALECSDKALHDCTNRVVAWRQAEQRVVELEAQLSTSRVDVQMLYDETQELQAALDQERQARQAAEAKVARLRDDLAAAEHQATRYAVALAQIVAESDEPCECNAPSHKMARIARQVLAEGQSDG